MRTYLAVLPLFAAMVSPWTRAEQTTSSGYVTAIASATRFELNGIPVQVTQATTFAMTQSKSTIKLVTQPPLHLGEFLQVTRDGARSTLEHQHQARPPAVR